MLDISKNAGKYLVQWYMWYQTFQSNLLILTRKCFNLYWLSLRLFIKRKRNSWNWEDRPFFYLRWETSKTMFPISDFESVDAPVQPLGPFYSASPFPSHSGSLQPFCGLFAAFCKKHAAWKSTWSMSQASRSTGSWARCSLSFAEQRARRMDGIGLFHFHVLCRLVMRICQSKSSRGV